jgi:hypothetical protein
LSKVFLRIDGIYGPKTAAAVKAYKNAPSRRFLQPGQTTADDIVGKLTIKSLDREMDLLDKLEPAVESRLVSTTGRGDPRHNHNTCPGRRPGVSGGADGRVQHRGTPINPQGFGRKINIGGEFETLYLGFQDFVTKTDKFGVLVPRPFSETLPKRCASDICLRSTPIDSQVRKEISRLALPACRFTVASPPSFFEGAVPFVLSLGTLLEDITVFDADDKDDLDGLRVFVIAMRGDGRFLDVGTRSPVLPPFIDF